MFAISKKCAAFWYTVESSLNIDVPCHIKNVLNLSGFNSHNTIKCLTSDKLKQIERVATGIQQKMIEYCQIFNINIKNCKALEVSKLMTGPSYIGIARGISPFKFTLGEHLVIEQIVEYTKSECMFGIFETQASVVSKTTKTTKTFMGEIFGQIEAGERLELKYALASEYKNLPLMSINDANAINEDKRDVPFDKAYTLLKKGFMMKLESVLKANFTETALLEVCGFKNIKKFLEFTASTVKINTPKNIFECIINYTRDCFSIKATMNCYCSMYTRKEKSKKNNRKTEISAFFRPNMVVKQCFRADVECPMNEFTNSWTFYNFRRHLKQHSKLFNLTGKSNLKGEYNLIEECILMDEDVTNLIDKSDLMSVSNSTISAPTNQFCQPLAAFPRRSAESTTNNVTSCSRTLIRDSPVASATSNMSAVISSSIPFIKETDIKKVTRALGWLLPSSERTSAINGILIQNIRMHLEEMKQNGYLRLFEIDDKILKPYMSETSWKVFLDFKEKREKDCWICPRCNEFCDHCNQEKCWKCVSCLFYFHTNCCKPQTQEQLQCFSCFYMG